jgi:hypothetical protein
VISLRSPDRAEKAAGEITVRFFPETSSQAGLASVESANVAIESLSIPRFADLAQSDPVVAAETFLSNTPPASLLPAIQALSQRLNSVMSILGTLAKVCMDSHSHEYPRNLLAHASRLPRSILM